MSSAWEFADPTRTRERAYYELGRRISERRIEMGMTQTDLGKLVGLSRTSISNIETGRQRIQYRTLIRVAFHLELTMHELVSDSAHLHMLVLRS